MRHIAVFARPAVVGRVKTRLSPALPPRLACELYRGMLRDALAAAQAASADHRTLWWAEPLAGGPDPDVPPDWTVARQRGGDLGERLADAFAALLRAPADRALVMGADCPALDGSRIGAALARLEEHDMVVGPALDGGYTLIGLQRPCPALFEDVPWSTPQVLARTLERAAALGLRVARLEPLADLDTPAALVRWLGELTLAPGDTALHTRSALSAMGLLPERAG